MAVAEAAATTTAATAATAAAAAAASSEKALGGLPYGPGLLYDDEDCSRQSDDDDDDDDDDDYDDGRRVDRDHGDRVLVRNRGEDRESGRQDALESPESHFCQYLGLEVFPDAAYLCTGFHAGQGPVSFGSDFRRRADCLVAVDLSDDDDDDDDGDGDDRDGHNGDGESSARRVRRAGRQQRRRRRHLLYYNLHGIWFHRGGRHLEDCPAAAPAASAAGNKRRREDEQPQQQRQRQLGRSTGGGGGSEMDGGGSGGEDDGGGGGGGEDNGGGGDGGRELRRRVAAALRSPVVADDGRRDRDIASPRPPPPFPSRREPSDWQRRKEADDLAEDSLKAAYADALSAVDPEALRLEYRVVHECSFSHGKTAPDPANFRPRRRSAPAAAGGDDRGERRGRKVAILLRPDLRRLERERQRLEEVRRRREAASEAAAAAVAAAAAAAGRGRTAAPDRGWADYPNARALLADKHPTDSLLGYAPRRMTQRTLVRRILEAGFNSTPGVTMGGFVVVQGGAETRTGDGVLPGAFAFCHQRTSARADGLGRFTAMQARMHWGRDAGAAAATATVGSGGCGGGKGGVGGSGAAAAAADARADAKLEAAASKQGTLSTPGYHRRGTAISLDFFRFLVVERGFAGYRLRHFV